MSQWQFPMNTVRVQASLKIDMETLAAMPAEKSKAILEGIGTVVAASGYEQSGEAEGKA